MSSGGKPWQKLHSHGAEESLDLPSPSGVWGRLWIRWMPSLAHQLELVRAERRPVVAVQANRHTAPTDGLPEHRQESADGLGEREGAIGNDTSRVVDHADEVRLPPPSAFDSDGGGRA